MQITDTIRLLNDDELIARIVEGQTPLFEILIRRYNPVLYKIARSCGLNHQDAEDMMQETHVAAYFELKKFRKESSYKTWISKIMLHKCYYKMNYGSLKYEQQDESLSGMTDYQPLAGMNRSTEKTVINKELASVLEQSLQQLPIHYRSVFVLREIEKFSVAETAEMLELTATNVKVRLSRARTMLQKEIESFYSSAEIFEFNLVYCDALVSRIFADIENQQNKG